MATGDQFNDPKLQAISALLASSAPRIPSPEVKRIALRAQATVALIIFGLIFAAFGSIFVVVFFPTRLPDEIKLGSGEKVSVSGTIDSVDESNMTINDTKVWSYQFTYRSDLYGDVFSDTCYTTGRSWQTGQKVQVEHLVSDPSIACVEGARLSKATSWAGLLVLIFPAVGIGLAYFGRHRRRTVLRILRDGRTHKATIVSIDSTSTRINNNTVYKISLQREDMPDGAPITVRRHNPITITRARKLSAAKDPMYILVDPQNPKRALMPELW